MRTACRRTAFWRKQTCSLSAITKGIRVRRRLRPVGAPTPENGVFGTDFWHAVEFSRSGRAPVRTFRSIAGQPVKPSRPDLRLSK
jgi:hypothetical protein